MNKLSPTFKAKRKIPLTHLSLNLNATAINAYKNATPHRTITEPIQRPHTHMTNNNSVHSVNTNAHLIHTDDKDKIIEELRKENHRLLIQNQMLAKEKEESINSMNEFAHSLGGIFETMITNCLIKSKVASTSRANKEANEKNRKEGNMEYLNKLKTSVTKLLQDSSEAMKMVNSALNV